MTSSSGTNTSNDPGDTRPTRQLDWYRENEIPGAQHPLGHFGVVPVATSIPECIWIAQAIAKAANHNGICGWRGQANSDWAVESGAARRVQLPWAEHFGRDKENVDKMLADFGFADTEESSATTPGSPEHDHAVRGYERLLLDEARVNGFGYHDGRQLSDLELLANLQHHGAATSLLDITKNLLVALWMAASEEYEKPGVVIAFGQSALRTLSADQAQKPLPVLHDSMRKENRRAGYWVPSKLNLRIVAQSGFFLLSPIADQPWGTVNLRGSYLWETEENAVVEDPDCYFIGVTPDLKSQMRDAQKFGLLPYAQNTIYPDLSGFAEYHSARRDVPFRR